MAAHSQHLRSKLNATLTAESKGKTLTITMCASVSAIYHERCHGRLCASTTSLTAPISFNTRSTVN